MMIPTVYPMHAPGVAPSVLEVNVLLEHKDKAMMTTVVNDLVQPITYLLLGISETSPVNLQEKPWFSFLFDTRKSA